MLASIRAIKEEVNDLQVKLRALATERIQHDHMALHARNIAIVAGAVGAEVEVVAAKWPCLGRRCSWSSRRYVGGILYRVLGFNTGVQFMGYYTALLGVPAILKLFGL